ncbi:olfactory receptor [Lynx pardinus]|uniref:Olfactory receptor n=1 Tax=Lynx pardinus TaxID=191816 RepID=A0A485PA88_LYNPA|nr:olfactory receptor [Lynx pardinus]
MDLHLEVGECWAQSPFAILSNTLLCVSIELVKIMGRDNDSYQQAFILVGFSDRPQLEHCSPAAVEPLGSREDHHLPRLCGPALYLHGVGLNRVCVLLAVMSYDRYVAVCRPLHYTVVMHPHLCLQLVIVSWFCGFINSFVMCPQTMQLSRCGRHKVDHFLCEMPALIAMSCEDTMLVEAFAFVLGVALLLVPLSLILISYGMISATVLRIKSAAGCKKAFNTCSSHLTVVSLFYGTIIYMYLQPANSYSQDQGKFLTLFYTIVTPSVNPLIYTLRNKDVKGAMRKLLKGEKEDREA